MIDRKRLKEPDIEYTGRISRKFFVHFKNAEKNDIEDPLSFLKVTGGCI